MAFRLVVRICTTGILAVAVMSSAHQSHAQPGGPMTDIEVPAVVLDTGDRGANGADSDAALDLANVVQSAAKGITTVQEAPAIVTVITDSELKDRQYTQLEQAFDTVPGWMRTIAVNQFSIASVRGQVQAVQFLHDGLSLFEPAFNLASAYRIQPVETIKRIEMITGPGGVLWGANSLVGILNVITKDAGDVDGVEVGGWLGGGDGDRRAARAYFMYGRPALMQGKVKLFLHGSVETYQGPTLDKINVLFDSPTPQPIGPAIVGPVTPSDPGQSYLVNLDGKVTLGALQIRAQYPFGRRESTAGFEGSVVRHDLGEDAKAECSATADTSMWLTHGKCQDRGRQARDNILNHFDRYVVADYRLRFAHNTAGIAARLYGIEFDRDMNHLVLNNPVSSLGLEGGTSIAIHAVAYRAGGAIDGDVELPGNARLLYGGEAFREWLRDNTDGEITRQGPGTMSTVLAPYDLGLLPLPCPHTLAPGSMTPQLVEGCPLTAIFPASRTVFGLYAAPQWRPTRRLILDAGARFQVAPTSLGLEGYDPDISLSSAVVYNFIEGWHLKLSFAEGFRPPVFNNTAANGEAIQIPGSPDLKVETSQAEQIEVNARIFKGAGVIRELTFRTDYSYTSIHDFIQIVNGGYANAADRGISSAELLARLYIEGGHRLELGYTWLQVATADRGILKSPPNNWFNLSGVFNLIDGKLTATTNLRVIGATDDPDRMFEIRDLGYDQDGEIINLKTGTRTTVLVPATALVLDRLPPIADLQLGISWSPTARLALRATVFNALNGAFYVPDAFGDFQPRHEFTPFPYEAIRGYLQASYTY
jgi:outer membrane receptor protein involved in Fe transport